MVTTKLQCIYSIYTHMCYSMLHIYDLMVYPMRTKWFTSFSMGIYRLLICNTNTNTTTLNFTTTPVRYQINARTELAIRYNDISPLENHHCAVAFQIFSNPETNIFANVDQTVFKRIRMVYSPS